MSPFRHIHIFGLGRAGLSLARSCLQAGLELGLLWNRSETGAARAQRLLNKPVLHGELQLAKQALAADSLVVIAVRDQAIAELCENLLRLSYLQAGQVLVHLAGAFGTAPLQVAAQQAVHLGVFHPLRSLDGEQSLWSGAVCGISGDTSARVLLHKFANYLGCLAQEIDAQQRPLYHAAASLAANDLLALFTLAEQALQSSGLEQKAARTAVADLMQSSLQNARVNGPGPALTGPLVRGDLSTLRMHFSALESFSPEAQDLHQVATQVLLQQFVADHLSAQQNLEMQEMLVKMKK